MVTLGERLKLLREIKGVSQDHVAKCVGIGRTDYLKYEKNISRPKYENLLKLAEFFETTPGELFGTQQKTILDIRDEIAQNKILDVNGEPMPPEVRDEYVRQLDLPINLRELTLRDSNKGQR